MPLMINSRQPVVTLLFGALLLVFGMSVFGLSPREATAQASAQAAPSGTATATKPSARTAAARGVDPRVALSKKMPDSKPEDFRPTSIPGVYEYAYGAIVVYLSADGRYLLRGDLLDLDADANLTENRRREQRMTMLAGAAEKDMIIFGTRDARHTVTVFTDIDCGFCRRFHEEIAKYNELGIRVRYLFFPAAGPDSEAWAKAETVWCSRNRQDALTRAKRGERLAAQKCASKVERDYELGEAMGLRGTPAIVLPNGEMLDGYLPPPLLARRLEAASPRSKP